MGSERVPKSFGNSSSDGGRRQCSENWTWSSLMGLIRAKDFQEYYNFEECLAHIEDYMIKHGPFDGLMGFSQGAIISAALPGMQLDGVALTKVPKIKYVIILSGGKFGGSVFGSPKLAVNAFSSPVKCSSLHIIGEEDFLKEPGIELLESFVDPFVIHHPKGHTIARLDEKGLKTMLSFIEKIDKINNVNRPTRHHKLEGLNWCFSARLSSFELQISFLIVSKLGSYQQLHIEKKMDQQLARKPRVLCFHGFRTSGKIFEEQTQVWPEFVREKMDLVFINAPFPADGGSKGLGAEELFDPPLYEWFQANKDFSEYRNFDECIAFVEDRMTRIGPFDGLMGFSQGAFLSAALPGMQAEGVALTSVPKIKFVIVISGGEKDRAKPNGTELLDSFVDPLVIHHPEGHVVPKLDEKGWETMIKFIDKIQDIVYCRKEISRL
ncbi:hypothetical protein RHGRI_030074 [Rhododendron griersonianum]|uniref:Serine hydrolase domain-containing protein n=1 Tax=Rhododendron griersonianum TaxID=479676 RepID=A0AAV6IQ90_9ERIC|nr:hypothetical protein RHGRI_030074 [Rhododendron griersonianum]